MKRILDQHTRKETPMLLASDTPRMNGLNGSARYAKPNGQSRKQRVTITLPVGLLERLRNAVYWTGHGTLARLIADSLDDAVSQMEQSNGQPFPQRLSDLKRGRPRSKNAQRPALTAATPI